FPAQDGAWDSIQLVLAVTACVAWGAAVIMLLPRPRRGGVVSGVIGVHFPGIFSGVQSSGWSKRVGRGIVYVYRHYLEFMYLNNAYHFYAPDPGPSYFFWFWVEYTEDGRVYREQIKVPNLSDEGWPKYPLAIQYQRRLALASLASRGQQAPANDSLKAEALWLKENRDRYEAEEPIIPHYPNPNLPVTKYLPPTPLSRFCVQSFVRHVAHDFLEKHPEARIRGIKVYR